MRFSTSAIVLASATIALAQTTHTVTVGANGLLTYDPPTIAAAVGDTVLFTFVSKNHTATQSAFDSPCSKLIGADGVTPSGFDSGFQPAANVTPSPTSSFVVDTTKPLWFYCRQTGHCAKGMVFAVNPPATGNTFDAFKAKAIASDPSASGSASSAPPSTSAASSTAPSASSSGMVTSTVPATSTAGSYSTPPPIAPPVTVTETITVGSNVYTTTYGSYPGSPAPTPNAEPSVIVVTVGGPSGLVYSPSNITAKPKDIIQFNFLSKNHTATQSSFSNPCVPLGATAEKTPFDSGFMPASDTAPVSWNVTVNDTAPIWVFCRQAGHCGKGMVFSVNSLETTPNTFDAFRNLAMHINGTTDSTNTTGSSTGTGTSASPSSSASVKPSSAGRNAVTFAGTGLALVGAVFAILL